MPSRYVVIGAGPVGRTVAEHLAGQGENITLLTRSGSGPAHPLIDRKAVDANDGARLAEVLEGASGVFHAIGAPYSARVWATELPRAQRSVLDAAHAAGVVVVFVDNLYMYSRPDLPMAEDSERSAEGGKRGIRARLLREREDHPADTVTVAASDFFGPYVVEGQAGERIVRRAMAGKPLTVVGSADQPHTFTYVPDIAAAMVAAAKDPRHWNRIFHTPSVPPLTQRQFIAEVARAAGVRPPRIVPMPGWFLRAAGLAVPLVREVAEMAYQFERPWIMDSTASQRLLGLAPTPLDDAVAATVAWWGLQGPSSLARPGAAT
jgi:nucleoside-diphosphate-sugar epimerase